MTLKMVPSGMETYRPTESYGPWALFFEKGSFETEFYSDPQELQMYLDMIPKDVSYWVQDVTTGEVVYRQYINRMPMEKTYKSAQMDSQSMPHGRRTFYEQVQNQMRPSGYHRKDGNWNRNR
jgi:hypothetical protein